MMEKQTLQPNTIHCFRAITLLLLVTCSWTPVRSSPAASNALHNLGGLPHPYSSIFSPLLKALSEHEEARWDPGVKKKIKPEHRYIKYLTEVYKKSPRSQRKVDGDKVYNTIRLIKPQDECLEQSDKESLTQDLSYNLDQIREKEQLLKSALLYRFDSAPSAPISSVCYLSVKERERSNQCQLCPGVHHIMNFTARADRRSRRTWVEVDITSFIQPLLKFWKKNVYLLVNVSCPEEQRRRSNVRRGAVEFSLKSPALILYLNDTSKVTPQRSLVTANEDQRSSNRFHRRSQKKRWRRESSISTGGHKNLNVNLPEILFNPEIPTSECALYDFRVKFSQLNLDHVIVHPPKYNPRYCRGICTTNTGYFYGSPRHAIVQSYIYENIDSSVPRPSCVPSHYRPLSVIISNKDGSLQMKDIDMVATRCTCR